MDSGLCGPASSLSARPGAPPRSLRWWGPPMIEQLVTRFEAARLDLRQRDLRRQEEAAIARLGEKTLADAGARGGRVASLAVEAAAVQGRLRAAAAGHGGGAAGGPPPPARGAPHKAPPN